MHTKTVFIKIKDFEAFLKDVYKNFKLRICEMLERHGIIKISACFVADFIKTGINCADKTTTLHIQCRNELVDNGTDLMEWYANTMVKTVSEKLDEFEITESD